MQGAIDLTDFDPNGIQTIDALLGHSTTPDWAGWCAIDWVTCGQARPMHPAWVQSLRDQCKAAKTPFLFKQWGEWKPISQMDDLEIAPLYCSTHKAKPHQDQEVIDDLYGKTCKVATSCLNSADTTAPRTNSDRGGQERCWSSKSARNLLVAFWIVAVGHSSQRRCQERNAPRNGHTDRGGSTCSTDARRPRLWADDCRRNPQQPQQAQLQIPPRPT